MIAPPVLKNNNKSDDSDSDSSDWDDDDDFASRKISINIKPINQVADQKISSSVDELRATVGTWKSLANINLVKPNSRRHHQSTLQLDNGKKNQKQPSSPEIVPATLPVLSPFSNRLSRLPVAFAIQECLDIKLMPQTPNTSCDEHLIGHIRMAVPPYFADPLSSIEERDLEFSLESSRCHNRIQINENFVERLKFNEGSSRLSNGSCQSFRIKIQPVREFARKRSRLDSGFKYFLLPELVRYYSYSADVGSSAIQPSSESSGFNTSIQNQPDYPYPQMNPLKVVSHWLCDLNVTKVRIDIALTDQQATMNVPPLTSDAITNLKVSLEMNGGVSSHHSKPNANWNPLDSRLTWSFANLKEFYQRSGNETINSCLAKFNLDDGPSTPSSVNVQFSINDISLTGTRIELVGPSSFHMARQKHEVRAYITEIR